MKLQAYGLNRAAQIKISEVCLKTNFSNVNPASFKAVYGLQLVNTLNLNIYYLRFRTLVVRRFANDVRARFLFPDGCPMAEYGTYFCLMVYKLVISGNF
jgi:hypothetical protein